MTNTRRTFFLHSLSCASALGALAMTRPALAQAVVLEADPQAVALGYSPDGAKTDIKKYPNYAAGRVCGGLHSVPGENRRQLWQLCGVWQQDGGQQRLVQRLD